MDSTTYIDLLQQYGRNSFSFKEAHKAIGGSESAVRLSLERQKKRAKIFSPYPKFYVVLPAEHRSARSVPAYDFVPQLMAYLKKPYYVSLLSAGEYHGAAHHRPQVFQLMVAKPMRAIKCGSVAVQFHVRKELEKLPTEKRNTKWGYLELATAETTAFDLVGYANESAGLDNVSNVLSELVSEKLLKPKALLKVAKLSPLPWAQRLGYLLDFVGGEHLTGPLADYVARHSSRATPLCSGVKMTGYERDPKWRVAMNVEVEVDV